MATVLIADPDTRTRVIAAALVEALGHRPVYDLERGGVDAIVVEPASTDALALARSARDDRRGVPVICVSARRRTIGRAVLAPLAQIEKPLPVGPFVRALTRALQRAPHRAAA